MDKVLWAALLHQVGENVPAEAGNHLLFMEGKQYLEVSKDVLTTRMALMLSATRRCYLLLVGFTHVTNTWVTLHSRSPSHRR